MFSDFIKHYNIVRTILRDVFLYGCFSIEGLEGKKKLSSRKISYEIRRIQQYVQEEFIRTDRDGRYKLLSLTYDSIRNTENFLVKTYLTKSFTRSDLILFFYLLMVLNNKDNECSFLEIEEELISKGLISYDNISSKTIERKLSEMGNSLGIINVKKIKRTNYYSIAEDIFKELDNEEIKSLIVAISLFKNILFPVTTGYDCEMSLKDYAMYERGLNLEDMDYFQYKNLHFHPVIEEQVLWEMLNAIHERKYVTLNYNQLPDKRYKFKSEILRPYKIRYDMSCGRFYLVSYDKRNKAILSRLDRTESVEVLKNTYEEGNLEELYERDMRYSWSSVPLNSGNESERIKLEIKIEEPKEDYIVEKIKSEVKECTIQRIDTGRYHLEMIVNDSFEMVPWIRSYSGYIRIIQGRGLKKRMTEDWKEMLETYGVF